MSGAGYSFLRSCGPFIDAETGEWLPPGSYTMMHASDYPARSYECEGFLFVTRVVGECIEVWRREKGERFLVFTDLLDNPDGVALHLLAKAWLSALPANSPWRT